MAWTKEQQMAIEKSGSNIIVSAGAGSGKTAVLSERVIYKLTHGIHIDELLILTFTRAAAEEMKDRIRDNIKAKPELSKELDALDSSYITTFDSFALSVVKKYHYLANVRADISISDETIVSLESDNIIDRVFDLFYTKHDEKFENLLKKFTLKNDQPMKNAIVALIKKIDTYIDRRDYIDYIKDTFFTEKNISSILDEFEGLIAERRNCLKLELESAYPYFEDSFKDKIDSLLLPVINTQSLDELIAYQSIKLPSLPRGSEDETKHAKENVKTALDDLMALTKYGKKEKIKEDIASTKDIILAIVEIIEEYYRELDEFKRKNDIFTFGDIASLAIDILKNNEEARLELKNKFKEIMIDEYQDTNDVQETFISMIANDNVYMVGDIKQAIYRFRGSNPSIFKDKYDRYSKGNGGYKIDLIKNFRSRKEVLENINLIFDLLMDDSLGGAEYTVSHEMVYGNTKYDDERVKEFDYNCQILEYEPDETKEFSNIEIEIFAIVKDIEEKMKSGFKVFDKKTGALRPFRYSDAVIILDRSTFFDQFKNIFEFRGIPLTILRDDKLNASTETYLLKNIIDFIIRIHNKDYGIDFKYDFLSLGRSFLYECTDSELFETMRKGTYWETAVYKDFSKVDNFNSMTVIEFIELILERTKFYDKIYKIGDYENINLRISKLIDIAGSLSQKGYTIYDFRDYLENIIEKGLEIKYTAYTGDVDSVKILTIHKSKGLEYALCYFADLDHKFNTKELNEKFISDHRYGIIAPILEEDSKSDSILKTLYKSQFMKDEIGEKIRLYYVALTRAREKFTILIPKKETVKLEKNRMGTIEEIRRLKFVGLKDFVYGVKDHLPTYFKDVDKNALGLSKDYLYNKSLTKLELPKDIEDFTVTELSIETEKTEKKRFSKDLPELLTKESIQNMKFGTKIHEILEFTDFHHYDSSLIEDDFIRAKVDGFVNSDLMKDVDKAKIYHEYEFVYEEDNTTYHGSIDLMLEYDDHIDIVDYKLKNTKDEHYLAQLAGYRHYIERISNKRVNTYLYSIIDGRVEPLE